MKFYKKQKFAEMWKILSPVYETYYTSFKSYTLTLVENGVVLH